MSLCFIFFHSFSVCVWLTIPLLSSLSVFFVGLSSSFPADSPLFLLFPCFFLSLNFFLVSLLCVYFCFSPCLFVLSFPYLYLSMSLKFHLFFHLSIWTIFPLSLSDILYRNLPRVNWQQRHIFSSVLFKKSFIAQSTHHLDIWRINSIIIVTLLIRANTPLINYNLRTKDPSKYCYSLYVIVNIDPDREPIIK